MCYDETTFAERYGISVEEHSATATTALPFSVRTINRLMSNKITTLAALLKTSAIQLIKIKGFGKFCLDEVDTYCATLRQDAFLSEKTETPDIIRAQFRAHKEQIAIGDFSFVEETNFGKEGLAYAHSLREAYDGLGKEMAQLCVVSPERALPFVAALADFQRDVKRYHEIRELLLQIPLERRKKKAIWYIRAFTIKDEERQTLQGFCKSEATTIAEFVTSITVDDLRVVALVKKFLKWCTFDLQEEVRHLFENLYANDRARVVIAFRAEGKTLEQAGRTLGITRERVRQIEAKVKRIFARLHSRVRIVSKIAAERNGDTILSPTEISRFCENFSTELLYLLQSYEGTNYTYDKQLDVFIVGDDSLHARVDGYIEALPNIVAAEQFEQLASAAEEDESIPKEMFEKAFFESYRQTGSVYHRSRLSFATIYQDIMNKYFPDGMHAYETSELKRFREYVAMDYGDVRLPENDRALTARIAGVGILCGRGMYRAKKKQYIPKELLDRIYKHIINNNAPVLLMGSLFSVFEDELLAAGVDNRYYLQGVLHEVFADKFAFRKDYISKDASITSFYTSVISFIEKAKYPVSKQQIQNEFPGITDIVITFAVSAPEILNYFGEYMHASNLFITDDERQYLHDVVSRVLSDNVSHHVKDFYEVINREKAEVLTRNAILYPFGAYSLLEYLFREQFQFSRPYIAPIGVEIGRPGERLKELIYGTDCIHIADIRDFAKDNRFQIQSMIDYVNACNDEFLLVDRDTLMRIDKVGITKTLAEQIESSVVQVAGQTAPIYQLPIWNALPVLSVPWTDWLLYSILNKWGSKVSVGTTSNQIKLAVPLVASVGKLDIAGVSGMAIIDEPTTIHFDDLDNIDELLEGIIGDDVLGGSV